MPWPQIREYLGLVVLKTGFCGNVKHTQAHTERMCFCRVTKQ